MPYKNNIEFYIMRIAELENEVKHLTQKLEARRKERFRYFWYRNKKYVVYGLGVMLLNLFLFSQLSTPDLVVQRVQLPKVVAVPQQSSWLVWNYVETCSSIDRRIQISIPNQKNTSVNTISIWHFGVQAPIYQENITMFEPIDVFVPAGCTRIAVLGSNLFQFQDTLPGQAVFLHVE